MATSLPTGPAIVNGFPIGGVGAGSSVSQSTSGSYIPQYEEEPFLNAIAQHAGAVGDQVYNNLGQLTNNAISNTNTNVGNFNNIAQTALGNANTYGNAYNQNTIPGIQEQFQQANNYASPSRIQADMGAAEAGAAQAGAAQHQQTVQDLQSYGLNTGDPSSGRYAALDQAQAVQNAATEAGAGQTARNTDIATGQTMLNNAISNSQPLLGASNAALNTGTQNITGAENAVLGTANTAGTLAGIPDQYYNTASALKYPTLGNQSQSTSASQSYAPSAGSGGSKSGGNTGTSPTQGTTSDPNATVNSPGTATPIGGSGQSSGNNPSIPGGGQASPNDTTGDNGGYSPSQDLYASGGSDSSYAPTLDPYSDQGTGTSLGADPNYSDPYSNGDTLGGAGYSDPYAGTDTSNYSGDNYGGSPDDTSAMAAGGAVGEGAIPDGPTTGGYVPPSASPSGGQQTDDVSANLNSGEFVIPKDVAAWKGQEFFQKLIEQSRKARVMSPAHPKPGAPRPGPAHFASRPMGIPHAR